jgi:hypothetical protein
MKLYPKVCAFAMVLALGLLAVSTQLSLRASGQATKPVTQKESVNPHTTASTVAISTPVKLCSGVLGGQFRDTITVPDAWKAGTCQAFAYSVGTTAYQLGCANTNSFSWGAIDGGTPNDNSCNW